MAGVSAWPLAIAGLWLFDDKEMVLCVGMATLGTFCMLALETFSRIDARVREASEHAGREQMLVMALNELSDTITRPQPVLRAVQ